MCIMYVLTPLLFFQYLGAKHGKGEKTESKQLENKHTSNALHANTPENSPKRKRTRNTPSSNASPATPDVPPPKRRRWSSFRVIVIMRFNNIMMTLVAISLIVLFTRMHERCGELSDEVESSFYKYFTCVDRWNLCRFQHCLSWLWEFKWRYHCAQLFMNYFMIMIIILSLTLFHVNFVVKWKTP